MASEIHEEVTVRLKNEPGALASLLETLAGAGVNVLGLCSWGAGAEGTALIVPDHPAKAKQALDAAKIAYELHPVIVVPTEDRPGAAAAVCRKVAAKGINIDTCYASGVGPGARAATVVLRTHDNGKAKEAMLFAILANDAVAGHRWGLTSATGSTRGGVLGKLVSA